MIVSKKITDLWMWVDNSKLIMVGRVCYLAIPFTSIFFCASNETLIS